MESDDKSKTNKVDTGVAFNGWGVNAGAKVAVEKTNKHHNAEQVTVCTSRQTPEQLPPAYSLHQLESRKNNKNKNFSFSFSLPTKQSTWIR
jgi:hypothetical protein